MRIAYIKIVTRENACFTQEHEGLHEDKTLCFRTVTYDGAQSFGFWLTPNTWRSSAASVISVD